MKFATVALFFSALAAASPVNTTLLSNSTSLLNGTYLSNDTITATVSTTITYYTTVWIDCSSTALSSSALTSSSHWSSSSSSPAVPQVTSSSSTPYSTTQTTTVSITSVPTTAVPIATVSTSSESTVTKTIVTNAASVATGTIYAGDGTWYYPSAAVGACGNQNQDNEYTVGIGYGLYDLYTPGTNPNENKLCGRKIRVFYQDKYVDVTTTDRCSGCKPYDLTLSPVAFSQLANQDVGRIKITWEWI
ncbi:hypothetical protein JCM33374_g1263 [Metschnikowia sp. JCM 33374]|nr:hypothetical protein JCM33374_g1263 [Metschnikowia sp. JCM 33374]